MKLTFGLVALSILLAEAQAVAFDYPFTTANIILIIGALTSSTIAIITVWRTGRKVDAVAAQTSGQDVKLNRIEVLVDGRYGAVLQRLADVLVVLADRSGTASDRARAESAQSEANAQQAQVAAAAIKEKTA